MIDTAIVEKMEMEEPEYVIFLRLKKDYHTKFAKLTGENIDHFLAVMYDGEIIAPSLPVIKAKIKSGRFQIGPYKDEKDAKELLEQILNSNEEDSL